MAEVLNKAELLDGDIIHVGFNAAKSEIKDKGSEEKPSCPKKQICLQLNFQ
jgi:hypothetical protein